MGPNAAQAFPTVLQPLLAALSSVISGDEADDLLEQATQTIPEFRQYGHIRFAYGDLFFSSGLQSGSDPVCRSLRLVKSLGITCAPRFVRQIAYPDTCSVTGHRTPGTEYDRLVPFSTCEAMLPASVAVRFWQEMTTLFEAGWVNHHAPRWGTGPVTVDPDSHVAYLFGGWDQLLDVTALSARDVDTYCRWINDHLCRAKEIENGERRQGVTPWHP